MKIRIIIALAIALSGCCYHSEFEGEQWMDWGPCPEYVSPYGDVHHTSLTCTYPVRNKDVYEMEV